jgi:tripartite-type tricarboxylate transporter receptor subunit TctC
MRALAFLVATVFAQLIMAPMTSAQTYPTRTITILVNSAPGGPTDIVARAIREPLQMALGQSVVVMNRDGAIGRTGAAVAAKAEPDGYTILLTGAGPMLISPLTMESMPYDVNKDVEPGPLCVEVPVIISTHPSVAKTLGELVEKAKKDPGKLTFASTGAGGPAHMVGESLKLIAGIDMLHVPYRGQPQAVLALMANEISMYTGTPGAVIPHAQAGKLNLLAITGTQRSASLPNVPTTAETGYPQLGAPAYFGTYVPSKTPRAIIDRIDAETRAALNRPDVTKQLESQGFNVRAYDSSKFKDYLKREFEVWGKVVKQAGIRVSPD